MIDNKRAFEPKKINLVQVVNYLNHAFQKAMTKTSIPHKAVASVNNGKRTTTPLYDYQVEFTYLIDNIQRGPAYIIPKLIQEANELIEDLENR